MRQSRSDALADPYRLSSCSCHLSLSIGSMAQDIAPCVHMGRLNARDDPFLGPLTIAPRTNRRAPMHDKQTLVGCEVGKQANLKR